jgi:hypothetical protein
MGARRIAMNNFWAVLLVIVCVGVACLAVVMPNVNPETTTITVVDKDVITKNGNSKYLIYTGQETFEIADNIFWGRVNSSDWYGHMQVGETYSVTAIGWRIPLFSTYRNIIKMEK